MQKRSKKGFTLAELLIVVAIIAVLVAIAVPLFVSGLSKAQKATLEANERAVRGAAVVKMLSMEATDEQYTAFYDENGELVVKEFWATADVKSAGEMGPVTLHASKPTSYEKSYKDTDGTYKILVHITDVLSET